MKLLISSISHMCEQTASVSTSVIFLAKQKETLLTFVIELVAEVAAGVGVKVRLTSDDCIGQGKVSCVHCDGHCLAAFVLLICSK